MDPIYFLMRLLHVAGAVAWVGGAGMMAVFVEPAVRAAGPEGGKFMRTLMQGRLSMVLSLAATVTVLSGAVLYWRLYSLSWIAALVGPGLGFTLGAVLGFVAWGVGIVVTRPAAEQLGALGRSLQGPPSPEQAAQLQRLQARLSTAARGAAALSAAALICMAVARAL